MDVELLRPGTVPPNPDSVLWFEFLLDPELLEKHFTKVNPDPSPENLVIKFLTTSMEPVEDSDFIQVNLSSADSCVDPNATKIQSCRRQSLKILAIKIIALWNFDLDIIESKLPICLQNTLLRELICITSSTQDSNVLVDMDFLCMTDEYMFSLALFHRWVLRTLSNALEFKQIRLNNVQGSLTENEELLSHLQSMSGRSEQFLKILSIYQKQNSKICIPTSKCFTALTEQNVDSHKHNFQLGFNLDFKEFLCQVLFDLSSYQIHKQEYVEAKQTISHCKQLFEIQRDTPLSPYCKVSEEEILGYCESVAVNVSENNSLDLMLLDSINNDYLNVIGILQQDNISNVIPMSARQALELDVAAALSTGKFSAARDLLFQIQTLNAVREAPVVSDYTTKLCATKKGVDILIWALTPLLKKASPESKLKIQLFLLKLFDQCDDVTTQNLLKHKEISSLFSKEEVASILKKKLKDQPSIESSQLVNALWNTQQEAPTDLLPIERNLIASFNIEEIKQLIYKLQPGNKPMWNLCHQRWKLPIPLQSVIMNLPPGFIQQYSFVLLAKAREMNDIQEYSGAQNMLQSLELELKKQSQNSVVEFKLHQLISWESLHFKINQLLDQWPAHILDPKIIVTRSQECFECLKLNDNHVIPRMEIIEACSTALLNLMEWNYLSTSPFVQRFPYIQMCAALSVACMELDKFKGNKKFSRDLWDLVVPIFALKRKNFVGPPVRESNISVLELNQFLNRVREPTAITVVATLLSRLHNMVCEEPGSELCIDFMNLWPPVLPGNPQVYPSSRVTGLALEILSSLLTEALKYEPNNVNFLKLMADIHFVNKHYGSAMKYYILSIISITDYFSRPINRLVDNHVYRRMIKCCIQLQSYTQAAVLCQFLDEVDYTTAFKSLSEENFCSDAMDSYYNCIWDMNILEFLVCLHHKRNEYVRKQQAINIIGSLELNSNNNEEIKREAANKRKTLFFQSLACQYVA